MKKYLLLILILLLATPAGATTWYACASTKNINSVSGGTTSDVWYSEAACTGGSWYAWTSTFDDGLSAGDILEANAQTALAINVNPGATGKKVHLKNTAGGAFTYATATNITINADLTSAGASTLLTISGSTGGLTIVGDIAATGGRAVYDGHTTIVTYVTGNVTGGTEMGYYLGGSGNTTITGNCTGGSGTNYGCYANQGTSTLTVAGNCTGGSDINSYGCTTASGSIIVVTGSIVHTSVGMGANGKIQWTPANSTKSIKFDGGGTAIYASAGIGSDAGGTQVSAANTAAEIATGKYFVKKDDGVHTQGTKAAGAGGAYAW